LRLGAVVLVALLAWGCQESSDPVGPGEGSGILLDKDGSGHPHGGGGGGAAEMFKVSVKTQGGSPDWATDQDMQSAEKKNWLHVFDSGGNGTRGAPDYANAAFDTEIHMEALDDDVELCDKDPADMDDVLRNLLYEKLDSGTSSIPRVFDFQVNFDIADNPEGFSIFLFRWKEKEDDDRIFSASTGFGLDGSDMAPTIDFLGDGDGGGGAIDDPSFTRVFRISGETKVIAQELDKNKVIATLACPNDGVYVVTVAPN